MTNPTPTNPPEIGMLIAPKHKETSFCTVLDVERHPDPGKSNHFKIQYLRLSDHQKIDTVFYPSTEVFWKYYMVCE